MSCLPVTELEGYGAYKEFGYALASLDYDKVSFFSFILIIIPRRTGFLTFSSRRHSQMMQIKAVPFLFLTVFTNLGSHPNFLKK